MSKNKVSDPITHQEIAFACLVLSGAMTDRQAAEAVGLHPDSAAYTKSIPRVSAYILEHRAAVQQQLAPPEAEGLHCLNPSREQVLDRLWEIANLSPEMTRSSITGQVKAISMIVAIQNFIPDRRALAAEKKSPPAPTAQIYKSAWLRKQEDAATGPQPTQQEDSPRVAEPASAPSSVAETPSDPGPTPSTSANSFTPSETPEPDGPFASVPDLRVPFSINFNPLARRR